MRAVIQVELAVLVCPDHQEVMVTQVLLESLALMDLMVKMGELVNPAQWDKLVIIIIVIDSLCKQCSSLSTFE